VTTPAVTAPVSSASGRSTIRPRRNKPVRAIGGFAPVLGLTWLYLTVLVVAPLALLLVRAAGTPWSGIVAIATSPRTLAALRVSFTCALVAALINVIFGGIVGWVLMRYRFFGRDVFDALVELPFALPTSVAGITLTYIYSESGPIGSWLTKLGIHINFTPLGITMALVFVGLPFVVRTVGPVVEALDLQVEEAAHALGASRWQSFCRVQFPLLVPSLLTGFALALARGIGEYGSVLFISGNLPMRTEIAPLLIVNKLEQYDYQGAAVLAAILLLTSFALLVCIHYLHRWTSRRMVENGEGA